MFDDEDDSIIYKVVVNDEDQYSIWPADRDNPLGWHDEGTHGSKNVCLDHIEVIWSDMRPRSLRLAMEAQDNALPAT